MPNRIKAAVTVAEKLWAPGKPYEVKVNAQHLFGAPASDRKCEGKGCATAPEAGNEELEAVHVRKRFRLLAGAGALGDARTDDEGNAKFTFQYTRAGAGDLSAKAVVVGRVFELGGRGVTGKAETSLWPSPRGAGRDGVPGRRRPGRAGVLRRRSILTRPRRH